MNDKTKQIGLYIIFGILTTVLNIVAYVFFTHVCSFHYLFSNVIAWVISVVFAFITNKIFVFNSKKSDLLLFVKEFSGFVIARLLTGGLDMFIMWILVDICLISDLIVKIISNVIVILLNYIFSKFFIFKVNI